MTRHIAIATPCYNNTVFTNYMTSMIRLMIAWKSEAFKDIHFSFLIRGGDSLIPRVRNSMVAEFLSKDEYTHLLWIDADIGFSPEDILRLLESDLDVVAGVYPLKKINFPEKLPENMTEEEFKVLYTSYPFNPISRSFTIPPSGFVEVLDAPTGLMMIKREVLTKMMKHYPEMKYKPDTMLGLEGLANQIDDFYYLFFDVMVDDAGRYLSEDYGFCFDSQSIIPTKDDGLKTIKWIVDNKYTGKVLSINPDTGRQEWNSVTAHWVNRNGKRGKPETKKTWVKINTDNTKTKLRVTSEHKIAVFRDLMNPVIEYVAAKDATGLYSIRNVDPETRENRLFNKYAMSAAIGTLMGDASIPQHRQMSISHCDQQFDYVTYKQKLFGGKITKSKQPKASFKPDIIHKLIVPVNAQTRYLKEISSKSGRKKHIENLLPLIDEVALAFWYMDDGTLGHGESPGFCTQGFTHDEHLLMQKMFESNWGIKTTIQTQYRIYKGSKKTFYTLYLISETKDKFFELIAPHIIPSMAYKIPEKYRGRYDASLCEYDETNNFAASFIKSVTVMPKHHSALYDIEVENNHNFFANGALAHNCRRWQKIGGKVYADLHSKLTHQGQYMYEGNVLKTLVARTEMLQKQEAEASRQAALSTEPIVDISAH